MHQWFKILYKRLKFRVAERSNRNPCKNVLPILLHYFKLKILISLKLLVQ